MNIKFDSKAFYRDSDKNIQTKIKICEDKVNRNFQGKKKRKEEKAKRLSLLMLDCVIRANKKYYPKHFWKSVNMK